MKSHKPTIFIISIILSVTIVLSAVLVYIAIIQNNQSNGIFNNSNTPNSINFNPALASTEPKITTETVVDKLSNAWDISFITDKIFVFTQRFGELRGFNMDTKENWLIIKPSDIYARGEGGMTGLKADVDFSTNRLVYICMNSGNANSPSIKIIKFQLSTDFKSVEKRTDIVTGLPANSSGRHSGCRIAQSKDGTLWIGTGDAATGKNPQDPKSLGGKILRVDREGKGVEGNLPTPFDSRIFSYGHRNTQGLVLFDQPINGVYGYTGEHGSNIDDEVNELRTGNFGWDPDVFYAEIGILMTDKKKFPNAVSAIWSSGSSTIAISGMTIINGKKWQNWDGALLIGVLKDKHIRLQKYDSNNKLVRNEKVIDGFGRIREIIQGPDDNLYFTTDNGGGTDKIVRVKVVN